MISPDIKKCRCCSNEKSISLFVKNKAFSSGIDSICLECNRSKVKDWRTAGHRDTKAEYFRYASKHREAINTYATQYRSNNPTKVKIILAKNRAKRSLRNANWDIELTDFLTEEAHELRLLRNNTTNLIWHVDHIIPLNGKNVSGLHVWNNIQVIPAITNLRKSNRYG